MAGIVTPEEQGRDKKGSRQRWNRCTLLHPLRLNYYGTVLPLLPRAPVLGILPRPFTAVRFIQCDVWVWI
ncbi:MAG: hypothetical protein GY703_01835 [Gammaproteobacteria bacterium]|nr:hypothetical protein [Gammaproteobacteria bacterium]